MFNATIQKISNQIETSNLRINDLEAQLKAEREQLKQLENHRQAFMTAASACQSAKEQVVNAIKMLQTVSPENITEFQTEINSLFTTKGELSENIPQKTPEIVTEEELDLDVKPENLAESEDSQQTTTIEVELAPEESENEEEKLSYKDLMNENYDYLKQIADFLNLENGSKSKIASQLKNQYTKTELKEIWTKNN